MIGCTEATEWGSYLLTITFLTLYHRSVSLKPDKVGVCIDALYLDSFITHRKMVENHQIRVRITSSGRLVLNLMDQGQFQQHRRIRSLLQNVTGLHVLYSGLKDQWDNTGHGHL